MRRLVWAFAGRTYHIVGNLMSWLKSCLCNSISDILSGNRQKAKRIYSCCYCVKVFDRPAKLTEHRRVHTREKPYSCDICEYRSTLKGNLKRHYLIHVKTADFWNDSSSYVYHYPVDNFLSRTTCFLWCTGSSDRSLAQRL